MAAAPATDDPDDADLPDDDLAVLARSAPDAFGELYRRYLGPVYRFCLRRVGAREAAEDAAAQVFLKALGGIATYHPSLGSFRSWLFAIAHRTVVDGYLRHRPTTSIDAAAEVPDRSRRGSPEETAEHADSAAAVARLLGQLPDSQRTVVELRLAGLTGPEIATALGRSVPSVKLAQFRAYQKLRALLADCPTEDLP